MKVDSVKNTPTLMESVGTEPKVMGGAGLSTLVLGIGFAIACAIGMAVPLAVPVVLITVGFALFTGGFAVNGIQWDRQLQADQDGSRARSAKVKEVLEKLKEGHATEAECFQELKELKLHPDSFAIQAEKIGLGDQYNSAYRDFCSGKN